MNEEMTMADPNEDVKGIDIRENNGQSTTSES